MGKKSGFTFPALQGLVGLFALLAGLLWAVRPEALAPWRLVTLGVSLAVCLGVGALIRRGVLSQKERDDMEKKHRVDAEDERNVRLREKSAYLSQGIMLAALCAAALAAALWRPFQPGVFAGALLLLCLHCFLPLVVSLFLRRRL